MDNFELEVDEVKNKVQSYFSQLIDAIKSRKAHFIAELDKILSRYRQERDKSGGKIEELEKLIKHYEDLSTSSKVRDLNDEILSRVKRELSEIEDHKSIPFSVEFECKPKDIIKAGRFGELKYSDTSGNKTQMCLMDSVFHKQVTPVNNVSVSKTRSSSMFLFSKKLYQGLIYKTDVGPIPRESCREEYLKSPFSNYVNWRVAIEGCYWCGKATNPNPYTYVCDKKCYQYFHEWCRRKLLAFGGKCLCKYPGCEEVHLMDSCVCSDNHLVRLESNYKSIFNKTSEKIISRGPSYYQIFKISDKMPDFKLENLKRSEKKESTSYQISDIVSDCSSFEDISYPESSTPSSSNAKLSKSTSPIHTSVKRFKLSPSSSY